jgi:excisionase family DNA binding protein
MNSPIITTAQAAKILGVSARTAQLWIESGVIPSWKTPGGHRRMYETDVLATLERGADARSATWRVLVLAPAPDHAAWTSALAALDVAEIDCVDNPVAAAVALGAGAPDLLLVQLDGPDESMSRFLAALRGIPSLSRLKIALASRVPATLGELALPAIGLGGGPEQAVRELAQHFPLKPLAPATLPIQLRNAAFPVGPDEARRLAALRRSGILDSAPEEVFDNLAQLAALSLSMPYALITVLSEDRQWFKTRIGLDLRETPRSWAFCNYTIQQSGVQEFSGMDADPRFADNPAVAGAPHFRYYAGAPVMDDRGFALGSLCVIDTKPRKLSAAEVQILSQLARQVSAEIARAIRSAGPRK